MSLYKVIVWRPHGIYRLPETIGTVSGDNEQEAVQAWIEKECQGQAEAIMDDRGFWRLYDEAQLPVGESFFLFEVKEGK